MPNGVAGVQESCPAVGGQYLWHGPATKCCPSNCWVSPCIMASYNVINEGLIA